MPSYTTRHRERTRISNLSQPCNGWNGRFLRTCKFADGTHAKEQLIGEKNVRTVALID
jgi:hypothetical protein